MSDGNNLKINDSNRLYDGFLKIDCLRLRFRRFDGGWSPEMEREVLVRDPAVAVLPYDPVRDQVVLIEQFRVGGHVAGQPAWMIEAPAGIVEPGETHEDVARRELREESGLEVDRLERIADIMPSPGGSSEVVRLFAGRVEAPAAEGFHGVADEGEDIRTLIIPADEALARLGVPERTTNAFTLIALQWLALNRQELRARWLAG